HAVAVVAHAAHHAPEQPARMDRAGRDLLRVGLADAEDVGRADRLRAEAAAQDVADHAAEAGVRAAVRLDRARVVVGLDLEADVRGLVELDDARVVLEDADAPGPGEVLGRLGDRRLEQVRDDLPLERDVAGEGLVLAVFAPGLGDGLELDVARLPPDLLEVVAD